MRFKNSLAINVLPFGLSIIFVANLFNFLFYNDLSSWDDKYIFPLLYLIFPLLAYSLGLAVNALIARFVFGWPVDKFYSAFLNSDIPSHWFKNGELISFFVNLPGLIPPIR